MPLELIFFAFRETPVELVVTPHSESNMVRQSERIASCRFGYLTQLGLSHPALRQSKRIGSCAGFAHMRDLMHERPSKNTSDMSMPLFICLVADALAPTFVFSMS